MTREKHILMESGYRRRFSSRRHMTHGISSHAGSEASFRVRKAGDNFVEGIDRAMRTQAEKGQAFRALHLRKSAFIIPNPWDIGSARMLAHLGFEALATTSGGYAFSMGQRDYTVSREVVLAHISALAAPTDLPLSADLENGFGDAPEAAAETIRLAAAAGAVGGSIEDATGS